MLPYYFRGHYEDWRRKRIDKLVSILGNGWLKGKHVLELGCGMGHVGRVLEGLGAIVTFADGRKDHLLDGNIGGSLVIDQDAPWRLERNFDLVVHWGVLYHLKNWRQDLGCALAHSNLVCLESEVTDSEDPYLEVSRKENGYDQALNGVGTRPSAAAIERRLVDLGATFVRYDDADLDSGQHVYSWKPTNSGEWEEGHRRFWLVRKAP